MPSAFCQMPLSSAVPAAIVGASAILMPSGRTYGIDPIVKVKRDAADTVEVESSARNVEAFANPALVASLTQSASAPVWPLVLSNEALEMNATRPVAGVTVTVLMWEVSKQ